MKLKRLNKDDFKEILKNYEIGDFIGSEYLFTGGNLVYKLTTNKGKYILKLYGTSNIKFVDFQIRLMEFLKNKKVSTPKIVLTKFGSGLLIWKKKKIAIQEFAKGRGIEYPNLELSKDMGMKWGILDKILMDFREKGDDSWKDNQFKLLKWNKLLFDTDLKKESKILFEETKKLDKSQLKRSLIHSDLCESNFLIWGNKVTAIIDWDDAHEDYTVYEVAITIAQNFTDRKKIRKKELKIFFKEYQKYIRFNEEERKALYSFVKFRLLDGALWCYNLVKKKKEKKELLRWTKIMIDKFNSFNKTSFKEFLEIMK